jgi:hypothetical protein
MARGPWAIDERAGIARTLVHPLARLLSLLPIPSQGGGRARPRVHSMRAGHTHILTTDHPSRPASSTHVRCHIFSRAIARTVHHAWLAAVLARSRSLDPVADAPHCSRAGCGVQSFFPISQSAADQATSGRTPSASPAPIRPSAEGNSSPSTSCRLLTLRQAHVCCQLPKKLAAYRIAAPCPAADVLTEPRSPVPLQGFGDAHPASRTRGRARVLQEGKTRTWMLYSNSKLPYRPRDICVL